MSESQHNHVYRLVVVDYDHTLTKRNGFWTGTECWAGKMADHIANSREAPPSRRFLAKLFKNIIKLRLVHDPDSPPGTMQSKFANYFSKGVPVRDMKVGADEVGQNEQMVGLLNRLEDRGYDVKVLSQTPSAQLDYWLGGAGLDYDYKGLELDVGPDGVIRGADENDLYTDITLGEGPDAAKAYQVASFLDDPGKSWSGGGNGRIPCYDCKNRGKEHPGVEIAFIGNSSADMGRKDLLKRALVKHYGWGAAEAQGYVDDLKVTNIYVPVRGDIEVERC